MLYQINDITEWKKFWNNLPSPKSTVFRKVSEILSLSHLNRLYVLCRKRYIVNKALKTTSEYVLFERLVLDMEVCTSDRSPVFLNIENSYTYNSKFITFWIEPKECTLDTDNMSTFKFHWTPDTHIVILKLI